MNITTTQHSKDVAPSTLGHLLQFHQCGTLLGERGIRVLFKNVRFQILSFRADNPSRELNFFDVLQTRTSFHLINKSRCHADIFVHLKFPDCFKYPVKGSLSHFHTTWLMVMLVMVRCGQTWWTNFQEDFTNESEP